MPKVQSKPVKLSRGLGPQRPAIVSGVDLIAIEYGISEIQRHQPVTLRQIEAVCGYLIEKQQWEMVH